MLSINDLKPGIIIIYNGQPHEVVEAFFQKRANEEEVVRTKLKNLITGSTVNQNFKDSAKFEKSDVSRESSKFLYSHQGQFWFCRENNPSARFSLSEEQIGENKSFLKPNTLVDVLFFDDPSARASNEPQPNSSGQAKPINIILPIKMDFKVIEAPPSLRGDTSQGGTKEVVIETRIKIKTPLFIEAGDTIRINTRTGEYVERVEKSRQ